MRTKFKDSRLDLIIPKILLGMEHPKFKWVM